MADPLPGINVTLNDLGLKIAPPPAGPKVTLLGVTSNTGLRIREPYTVSSVDRAMNSLYFDMPSAIMTGSIGGVPGRVPGELALAIEEAIEAGAPNVEIMIIATASGQALLDYINPYGVNPTGRYVDLSGAYDILRNRELDVVVPVGAYMDQLITGRSDWNFGKQLADFCYRATKESNAAIGVIPVRTPLQWAMSHRVGIGASPTLSGELASLFGITGAFTGSFTNSEQSAIWQGMEFGVPSAALVSEWVAYHAYQGKAGYAQSALNLDPANYNPGYLAWLSGAADQQGRTLADLSDTTSVSVNPAYFPTWQAINSDGSRSTDSRGNKTDAGAYISVFAAPLRSVGTQTRLVALGIGASPSNTSKNINGAPSYAGKITSLAPQSSTTNKALDGVTASKLLSVKQASDLTGMRIVTMHSRTKGLTVSSGVTGAFSVTKYVRSDYVRLTTVRITTAAVDLIRAVGDKYIGEPNNAPQMNALDAEIDQVLLSMKGQGALRAYDYSISSTPDQRVLGQLDVNLILVPAFEIQQINLVVSLAKEL